MSMIRQNKLSDFLDNPHSFSDIRLHGNGFIQLDLGDGFRFHVWSPTLPRQVVSTQIHDHRFGFSSEVLLGNLTHVTYTMPMASTSRRVYRARPRNGEDTELCATEVLVRPKVTSVMTLTVGSTYTFPQYDWHSSMSDTLTATLMHKHDNDPEHTPRVLVPLPQSPDNDFNRYKFGVEALWNVVDGVVRQIRHLRG